MYVHNWVRKNISGQLFLTLAKLVRVVRVIKNEVLYLGHVLGSHVPKSGPIHLLTASALMSPRSAVLSHRSALRYQSSA